MALRTSYKRLPFYILVLVVCLQPIPLYAQLTPNQKQLTERCVIAATNEVVQKLETSKFALLVVDHTDRSAFVIHCERTTEKGQDKSVVKWQALPREDIHVKHGDELFLSPDEYLVVSVERTNTALYTYASTNEDIESEELKASHSFLDDIGFYLVDVPGASGGTTLLSSSDEEALAISGLPARFPDIEAALANIDDLIVSAKTWIDSQSASPLFLALTDIKAAQVSGLISTLAVDESFLTWNGNLTEDLNGKYAGPTAQLNSTLNVDSVKTAVESLQASLKALEKDYASLRSRYRSGEIEYFKLERRHRALEAELQSLEEEEYLSLANEVKTHLMELKQLLSSNTTGEVHSLREIQLQTLGTLEQMVMNDPEKIDSIAQQLKTYLEPDLVQSQSRLAHVERVRETLRNIGAYEPMLEAISANIKARNVVLAMVNSTSEAWNEQSEDLIALSLEINHVVCEINMTWLQVAEFVDEVRDGQTTDGTEPLATPEEYLGEAAELSCTSVTETQLHRLPAQPLLSNQFIADTQKVLENTETIIDTVYDTEALVLKTVNASPVKILDKPVYASLTKGKKLSLKVAASTQENLARLTNRKPFALRPLDLDLTVQRELINALGWALRPRVGAAFTFAPEASFGVFEAKPTTLTDMVMGMDPMEQEAFVIKESDGNDKQVTLNLTMGFEWHQRGRVKRPEAGESWRLFFPELLVSLDTEAPSFGIGIGVTRGVLKLSLGSMWARHAVLENQEVGRILQNAADLQTRNTYRGARFFVSFSFIGWPPFVH